MNEPVGWIIPHTHWDREWYEPHDVFRARLVVALDSLLDILELDPKYRFTLDGQSAAATDYLEMRPENTERLAAAVSRGQLALGPFNILHDEFCCDGETTIRNLEIGVRAANRFGGAMSVAYLPDMFGHAAQTPQIVRGFGIEDSCVWRGVPGRIEKDAFLWEALNGDSVRVEYLWDGYGSALTLFEPVEKLPHLLKMYVEDSESWNDGRPIAGMYGTDHMIPRRDLGAIIREHNENHPELRLEMATLGDVVASRDHSSESLASLPVVKGEMRSASRGNVLPGVLSIRTGIKDAMASAERALAVAERIDAWAGGPSRTRFLERGWFLAVESSAHDSATGCGVDETASQVEERLRIAHHTARGVIDIASNALGACGPLGSTVVFNPSGWARTALVEMRVEGPVPTSMQHLSDNPTILGDEYLRTSELRHILNRIHGLELFGNLIQSWKRTGEREITFVTADVLTGSFDRDDFVVALDEMRKEAASDDQWHVLTSAQPTSLALAAVKVNAMSNSVVIPGQTELPTHPVCVESDELYEMSNGLVSVRVDSNGSVDISTPQGKVLKDAIRFEDSGDCGDTYNYGPTSKPAIWSSEASVSVIEAGPLRGKLQLRHIMDLPVGLVGNDRSEDAVEQVITTVLELRADEHIVRVTIDVKNRAENHRFRLHVPTGCKNLVDSDSTGQYGTTIRGRTGEGGWGEYPIPTYPATRSVHAGDARIHLRKLTEYEVVSHSDGDDTLALTLLRSVGVMSVNLHPYRDEPAAQQLPTPEAQYKDRQVVTRLAFDLSSDYERGSDLLRYDPVTTRGKSNSLVADKGPLLSLSGRVTLESLRRVDGGLEARFVNYSREPQDLAMTSARQWVQTDLRGEFISEIDPSSFTVPGSTILTLRSYEAS